MIKKEELKEKIEQGAVVARLVVELLGKPKEHIDETMKLLVQRLKEEKNVVILKEELFEAEFREDSKLYSSFVEIEILVDDLPSLAALCMYYMPSSVEIVEPSQKLFKCSEMTDLFNDLMGKLHKQDMAVKNLRIENETHRANMGKLLKSSIMAILEKERSAKDVADILKIPEEQANTILEHMLKQKMISKQGRSYVVR